MKIDGPRAWDLLKEAKTIVTFRGKKSHEWDPKKEDKEPILKHATGRTGNLRAPTIRLGNNLLIGFNEEGYQAWF